MIFSLDNVGLDAGTKWKGCSVKHLSGLNIYSQNAVFAVCIRERA